MKIFILFFFSTFLYAEPVNYLLEHNKKDIVTFETIQTTYNQTYEQYQTIQKQYIQSIKKNFKTPYISNSANFIVYKDNFTQRIRVDFSNGVIYLEVIAQGEKEAADKTIKMLELLLSYTLDLAIKDNIVEQKLAYKVKHIINKKEDDFKPIGMLYTKDKLNSIKNHLIESEYASTKYNDKTIYTTRLELPIGFEKKYKNYFFPFIKTYAQKYQLEENILWALVENESHFNPFLSINMRYGILQLSPLLASISHHKQTGIYKTFYSEDLFDIATNFNLACQYFHTLLYEELFNIYDMQNRYMIFALVYNYGIEDVIASLHLQNKDELITLANINTNNQLYKYLLKKLPREKRKYFFSFMQDTKKYQ